VNVLVVVVAVNDSLAHGLLPHGLLYETVLVFPLHAAHPEVTAMAVQANNADAMRRPLLNILFLLFLTSLTHQGKFVGRLLNQRSSPSPVD
jgi:hypothetical protein